MKKILILLTMFLLVAGCGKNENPEKIPELNVPDKVTEVKFCQHVSIYDENGEKQIQYTCTEVGSQDTKITVVDKKEITFEYHYENEHVNTLQGEISNCDDNDGNGIVACDVKFEGEDEYYSFAYSEDSDVHTLCTSVDDSSVCWLFKEDKTTGSTNNTEEETENTDNSESSDFANSKYRKDLDALIKESYADYNPVIKFDAENNMYSVTLTMPAGSYDFLTKNFSSAKESWSGVTSTTLNVSKTGYDENKKNGYGNIAFAMYVVSDKDQDVLLYACMNGEVYYDIADDLGGSSSSNNSSSSSTKFTNKYGTSTTKCHHSNCNNYIASSGDTWDCASHSNKCLKCKCYIDCDATYCMSCLSSSSSSSSSSSTKFTNKYGTANTKCHHSGCNNKIASSGDTWDCASHSNKCLECKCYIDCDAVYCMSCLTGY